MEPNAATVTIRLKPYLQEYLRCKLQSEDISAKGNFLGTIIRPFLSLRPSDEPPCFECGPEFITIQLPTYQDLEVRRGTVHMSEKNQEAFGRILNAHFWEMFFNYMDDKVRYMNSENTRKGTIKRVILQFCSDHNISYNSLNYEMMKKAYYRRRVYPVKKSKSIFAKNLSLSCPLFFLI
jgi:hypothetical protein